MTEQQIDTSTVATSPRRSVEMVNIDPHDIVKLVKRLIEIHQKWIIDGVSDAEDKENENAGLREQQTAIEDFAARQGLPESAALKLSAAIRNFLNGGPTGDGDGPLVEDTPEVVYKAFAVRLLDVITAGRDLHEVLTPVPDVDEPDTGAQIAWQRSRS
jgi:hypothetical protein